MFAHQVIEDLKLFQETIIEKQFREDTFQHIKNSLILSQKFHLEDIKSLYSSTSQFNGKKLFHKETFVRLPYKVCWFDYLDNQVGKIGILAEDNIINNISYGLSFIVFLYYPKEHLWCLTPVSYAVIYADDCDDGNFHAGQLMKDHPICDEMIEFQARHYGTLLNATLMLLSCKNIITKDNLPPVKLNLKRQKHGKCPVFTYKTLVLKPTTQYEKSIPQHLWENRIHLCRGHFKEYTPEHPLFGKLTGRYWWQPHVRGQNHDGIVMKDYEVKQAIAV
jgi:hypothetical protein